MTLDEDQKRFRDLIWNPDVDVVFVDAKAGSGKAQPNDTIIPTPNGMKKIGELSVGDYVFDLNGNPTKVLGVFPQGEQEEYEIEFVDGRTTRCCKEHLWTYYGCRGLVITETLSSMMQRTIRSGRDGNALRYNIPLCKPVKFPSKNYKISPYAIGTLIANGCLSEKKLTVSCGDEDVIKGFCDEITADGYKRCHPNNYSYYFFMKHEESKADQTYAQTSVFLKDYQFLIGCKSYEKMIPEEYMFGDVDQRFDLLSGLFDNDGCITTAEGRYNVTYSTTSYELAKQVVWLSNSLGIRATIHKDEREGRRTCFSISVLCENSIKHRLFKYSKTKVKKSTDARTLSKHHLYDRIGIKDVRKTGRNVEMTCIFVDNDEHLYLTNDFIVTHNTTVSVATSVLLVKYNLFSGIHYVVSANAEGRQGYLPGSQQEKTAPYLQGLWSALETIGEWPEKTIKGINMDSEKEGTAYITAESSTYLRGANIGGSSKKILIIDEAQNFTVPDLRKTLTRACDGTKVIVIGHQLQTDIPKHASGFLPCMEHFRSKNNPRFAFCELTTNHRSVVANVADEPWEMIGE